MTRKLRVAFTTLGCKVNQYDTATMQTALRGGLRDGAVRRGRRRLRRQLLHRDRPRRRREPAAGAPGAAPESRRARDPHRLLRADQPAARRSARGRLRRSASTGCPTCCARCTIRFRPRTGGSSSATCAAPSRSRTLGAEVFTGQTRAFLKVQEGCDLFCTFCIVPMARGRSRSVPPRRVLAELERLAGARLPRGGADRHPPRRLRQGPRDAAAARRSGRDDRRGGAAAAHPAQLDRPAGGDAAPPRPDRAEPGALRASAHARAGRRRRRPAPHAAALRRGTGARRRRRDPSPASRRRARHRRHRRLPGRERRGLRRHRGAAGRMPVSPTCTSFPTRAGAARRRRRRAITCRRRSCAPAPRRCAAWGARSARGSPNAAWGASSRC